MSHFGHIFFKLALIRIEKSIQLKFVKYRKNVTLWMECFGSNMIYTIIAFRSKHLMETETFSIKNIRVIAR